MPNHPKPSSRTKKRAVASQLRVALIDADPPSRQAFTELLANHELLLLPYPAPRAFLRHHVGPNAQWAEPDLLLIRLETDERLETLSYLTGWQTKLAAVVYSTGGDVSAAVRCFQAGADDFIDHAKPDACFAQRVIRAIDSRSSLPDAIPALPTSVSCSSAI